MRAENWEEDRWDIDEEEERMKNDRKRDGRAEWGGGKSRSVQTEMEYKEERKVHLARMFSESLSYRAYLIECRLEQISSTSLTNTGMREAMLLRSVTFLLPVYLYPLGQHAKNKKVLGPVKVLVLSFHYNGHKHSDNSRWATDWMKWKHWKYFQVDGGLNSFNLCPICCVQNIMFLNLC